MTARVALFCILLMCLGATPAHAQSMPSAAIGSHLEAVEATVEVRHYHRQASKRLKWSWWSDQDGKLIGSIERHLWKQFLRCHIVFRDADGQKQAEGTQPWRAAVTPAKLAPLRILDAEGQVLVHAQGLSLSNSPKRFRLTDGQKNVLGDAWVDSQGQEVCFTMAGRSFLTFAILTRQGQSSDRWELSIFDSAIIPELAWPILVDFFLDPRYTR